MQVRHQSLQIILMMAPHYIWIKSHLLLIAEALENTLQDEIPTIRLRAARCLDVVVHSINTHLLSQSNLKNVEFEADVEIALQFWSKILNILTEQLQDLSQSSAAKSTFCDAFSDIGVHVYERLPVQKKKEHKKPKKFIFKKCIHIFFSANKTNAHNCLVIWIIVRR